MAELKMANEEVNPVGGIVPSTGYAGSFAESLGAVVAGVRRLAMQRDLLGMATVAAETGAELAQALRARCYLFHAEESLLWTEDGDAFPASAGLTGFAARSREARVAPRAALDPSYCREVDDPDGAGTERLLAQPITTSSGEIHAVVVVARSSALPEFSPSEVALFAFWAEQVAPLFHMLHLEGLVEGAHPDAEVAGRRAIYREEALEVLADGEDELAVLLGRTPWWLRQAHLLGPAVVVVAALFVAFVRVADYTSAPAVVVVTGDRGVALVRGDGIEAVADDESQRPRVRVLVPAQDRAALEIGQLFLFDLDGFPGAVQRLRVVSISERALGAGELGREVGAPLAARLATEGPIFIVEAQLRGPMFEADGRRWAFHDGMTGRAAIAVRRKPIAYLLFPGLERMLSDV